MIATTTTGATEVKEEIWAGAHRVWIKGTGSATRGMETVEAGEGMVVGGGTSGRGIMGMGIDASRLYVMLEMVETAGKVGTVEMAEG